MNDYLDILQHEFNACEGSFLNKLRSHFLWEKEAFSVLIKAMKLCCADMENEEEIPKWLARGFYVCSYLAKDISQHEGFKKVYPEEYYNKACRRLDDLASWFFKGKSPYMGDYGFDDM